MDYKYDMYIALSLCPTLGQEDVELEEEMILGEEDTEEESDQVMSILTGIMAIIGIFVVLILFLTIVR